MNLFLDGTIKNSKSVAVERERGGGGGGVNGIYTVFTEGSSIRPQTPSNRGLKDMRRAGREREVVDRVHIKVRSAE